MTNRQHIVLLWKRACFRTIVDALREKHVGSSEVEAAWVRYRIGQNLFYGQLFQESLNELSALCDDIDEMTPSARSGVAQRLTADCMHNIHVTIGRCATTIFLISFKHELLQIALEHYEHAVSHITYDLSAMIRVPMLLLEYGKVLELLSAFETAQDVYTQVLTNFPIFRGYFNALFRAGLVGLHMAIQSQKLESGAKGPSTIQVDEAVDKCIDIFQFLLEAPPPGVDELHLVLLYGRAFELSSSAQQRFRATTVWFSFYENCKRRGFVESAQATSETSDREEAKEWLANPKVWFSLGRHFLDVDHEPLVALLAFQKLETVARRAVRPGQDLASVLGLEVALNLAETYQLLRLPTESLFYAELAARIDRFAPRVRDLLLSLPPSSTSGLRWTEAIQREILSARRIARAWRERVWTPGFTARLRREVVVSAVEKLETVPFDASARKALAYHARDQYRSRFLFETQCAVKIQRRFRDYRRHYVWRETMRRHVLTQAADLVHRFPRNPQSPVLRSSVLALSQHRLLPSKHPLRTLARRIQQEQTCIERIVRAARSFLLRCRLWRRVEEARAQQTAVMTYHVLQVQRVVRRFLGIRAAIRRRRELAQRNTAAIRIQQAYRRYRRYRKRVFVHRKLQRLHVKERQELMKKQEQSVQDAAADQEAEALFLRKMRHRALQCLRRILAPLVRKRAQLRRKLLEARDQHVRKFLARETAVAEGQRVVIAVVRIQRFYRSRVAGFWFSVSRQLLRQRRRRRRDSILFASPLLCAQSPVLSTAEEAERRVRRENRVLRQLVHHLSPTARALIAHEASSMSPAGDAELLEIVRRSLFKNPGIQIDSPMFEDARRQQLIVVPAGESIIFDLQVVGRILLHPQCCVRVVVLVDCDVFAAEDKVKSAAAEVPVFLKGVRQCKSLRGLILLGGHFSAASLDGLFFMAQQDNARIQTLCVEQPSLAGGTAETLVWSARRLLCDVLSGSLTQRGLGGLLSLSLHGAGLWDSHVQILSESLVTTSLVSLCLSLNLLTDEALLSLMTAACRNVRKPLQHLDMVDNLIRLRSKDLRDLLWNFRAISSSIKLDTKTVSLKTKKQQASSAKLHKQQLRALFSRQQLRIDLRRNPVEEAFDSIEAARAQGLSDIQLCVIQDNIRADDRKTDNNASAVEGKKRSLSISSLQSQDTC